MAQASPTAERRRRINATSSALAHLRAALDIAVPGIDCGEFVVVVQHGRIVRVRSEDSIVVSEELRAPPA